MAAARISALAHQLTLSEGKCLRYIVSTLNQPVDPNRVTNKIAWSDLPHSYLQAKLVFSGLELLKLISKQTQRGYTFTTLGKQVVEYANSNGMWRQPPQTKLTQPTRRK